MVLEQMWRGVASARGGDGMKRMGPPLWMERLLKLLLPERDREAVTGSVSET